MKAYRKYMKAIGNGLETGGPFCWDCYGAEARFYDSKGPYGWDASMVADSVTQTVFEISLTHDESDTALRWINPKYIAAFKAENREKGFNWKQAYDDVEYEAVSKKEILREIKNAFSGRWEVEIQDDYEPIEIKDTHEYDDGSLGITYSLQPPVAEAIINDWLRNALAEKANEVIAKAEESERATRELAEKEGGSSYTVESDETQWHYPIIVCRFGDEPDWIFRCATNLE